MHKPCFDHVDDADPQPELLEKRLLILENNVVRRLAPVKFKREENDINIWVRVFRVLWNDRVLRKNLNVTATKGEESNVHIPAVYAQALAHSM